MILTIFNFCFFFLFSCYGFSTNKFFNKYGLVGRSNSISMNIQGNSQYDVVIIGSGIAGLSCGALLASQGVNVCVCESHYEIGGCAHEFLYTESGKSVPSDLKYKTNEPLYHFEAGPSLYSGLSTYTSPNPLKHVYQAIGEEPEWITYKVWKAFLPEAPEGFSSSVGAKEFEEILSKYGSKTAIDDWRKLADNLRPLTKGVMALPTAAMRPDLGSIITVLFRYPNAILDILSKGKDLTKPFSEYYKELNITDDFLKNYLNLLCFLLQGLPAEGTLSAVMSYMIEDFFKPNAVLDYPKGGSGALVASLEKGILKHNGVVKRRAHVEEVLISDGRATGVKLRNGQIITAKQAVVSNCDMYTTYKLIPKGINEKFDEERNKLLKETKLCQSFMHLHIGFDATGLPNDIPPQWTVCNDWNKPIDAPGNVIVVSMASLLDPSLAPENRHVIHAYTAGNEPYDIWSKYKDNRNSKEYEQLKEERVACLWEAIEKQIPDIKKRVKVQLIGTPLTHERYNRRYEGSYGPAIAAGSGISFPGQKTAIPGYLRCGDSTNPGIGVPAVAASGAVAASALLPIWKHIDILDKIRM